MKLTLFYFPECPHCRLALKLLEDLKAEDSRYAAIEIEKINERTQPELADRYDYYYVPTFFLGQEKLHEGHAEREDIVRVLERALQE